MSPQAKIAAYTGFMSESKHQSADPALQEALRTVLSRHPDGLPEHSLLLELDRLGVLGLPPEWSDSPALFDVHFRLFHALYHLQARLWESGDGHLEIDPVCIRLGPWRAGRSALTEPDPLRAWYLDDENRTRTTAEDLDEMLGRFWSRLNAPGERQQALALLGLTDPVDELTIRRRFRELAMAHHPDRGGDTARFQELQQAIKALKPVRN